MGFQVGDKVVLVACECSEGQKYIGEETVIIALSDCWPGEFVLDFPSPEEYDTWCAPARHLKKVDDDDKASWDETHKIIKRLQSNRVETI